MIFEQNRQRGFSGLTGFDDFRSNPSNRPATVVEAWRCGHASRSVDGMTKLAMWLVSTAIVASVGCHGDDEAAEKPRPAARAEPRRVPQVPPPIDVAAPPKDATRTGSGLSYKRLNEHSHGLQPRIGESVLIRYTGWRQRTGETFFTTGLDGQTIAIDPAYAGPGFREMIPLLHKGEKVMLWLPAGGGMPEPVVYEIELVDVVPKAAPTYSALH
jgi:hypothetical protein